MHEKESVIVVLCELKILSIRPLTVYGNNSLSSEYLLRKFHASSMDLYEIILY